MEIFTKFISESSIFEKWRSFGPGWSVLRESKWGRSISKTISIFHGEFWSGCKVLSCLGFQISHKQIWVLCYLSLCWISFWFLCLLLLCLKVLICVENLFFCRFVIWWIDFFFLSFNFIVCFQFYFGLAGCCTVQQGCWTNLSFPVKLVMFCASLRI